MTAAMFDGQLRLDGLLRLANEFSLGSNIGLTPSKSLLKPGVYDERDPPCGGLAVPTPTHRENRCGTVGATTRSAGRRGGTRGDDH